jgi:rod shape-determining protein MreC
LLAYLALAITLIVLDDQAGWLARLREQANSLVQPVWALAGLPGKLGNQVKDSAASHTQLVTENRELRNQLLLANARLTRLQTAALDNAQLRELLNVAERSGLDVQLAPILDIDLDPVKQRLVLDAGSREGVHVGQAVIDAGGLMGQVIAVTGGTSTVLLLTDPDHAVPVTVARNGVRLIVYGRGDTLELRDIPLSAGVEVGDEIVTSGLGGRFPAGFPVGTITGLRPDDTHAFLVGELKPAAQLDRGRDVLLLRPVRRSAFRRNCACSWKKPPRVAGHRRQRACGSRASGNDAGSGQLPGSAGRWPATALVANEDCCPRILPSPGAPSKRGLHPAVHGSAGRWPATDHAGGPAMSRLRDNPWVLPASLVVALLLGLLPLPALLQPLRPYWLALVLAYWVIEAPERVGLGIAFASGVVADLLYGGVLGEQALRLVMLAFILQRFRARIRFFPMSQQMLAIGGLLFNDRIVSALVHILVDEPTLPWSYWWAPLLGMGLWPLVFVLLDAVRFGKRGR